MPVKIQVRKGLSSDWVSANPVLLVGEQGFELDTNKIKIGNGASAWNNLPYLSVYSSASSVFSSSVNWTGVIDKPDPIIGINLTGNTTGAASVTLTDLNNGQISVTTNTSFATAASSIAGSLVTGTVSNASHASTASSISGNLVSGIVSNASHSFTASSINSSLLTGTLLPSSIVQSNLTSVGVLNDLTVTNLIAGRSSSANISIHSNTASSINWSLVTDKPLFSPQIGVNLTGVITGAASATLNNLSNTQITINTEQNISITTHSNTASYTLQLYDAGKLVLMNHYHGNFIIVPPETSVNFPVGSKIDIAQIGAGTSSVTYEGIGLLNSDSNYRVLNNRYAAVSLVKLQANPDYWILLGGLK